MKNENMLLDEFFATGKDYSEFKDVLNDMSDCTEFVKITPMDVSVLSLDFIDEVKEADATETTDNRQAHFWNLCPAKTGIPQKDIGKCLIKYKKVLEKGNHLPLLEETFTRVKTLFYSDGKLFFPAKKIFSKGLVQFGAGGSAMDDPSYERNLYVSSLFSKIKLCTFVVREIAGAKKLVSILSSRYKALPQSVLCDIVDSMDVSDFGRVDTYKWYIDNWISSIYVEFPEKAKEISDYYELSDEFVPGLWLQTSDTGDAAIKVYPTWRHGKSISFVEKSGVRRVHSGDISPTDFLEHVKAKAFAEYTRFPKTMCELMTQDLTDASWDLTTSEGVAKNLKMVEKVLKKAFKTLRICKAIGKGNKKALFEQLLAEFTGDLSYTAYDIATALLSLPERLEGVHSLTLHNLEAVVAEAPYIKYGAKEDDDDSDEEELVLI